MADLHRPDPRLGYVDWPAVIAGAFCAAALSFVLLTFGSAIGLSVASPWSQTAVSTRWVASAAAFFALALQILSYLVGGYIAGRLRPAWPNASREDEAGRDEVEFRDGAHGLLVWSLGVVFSALLAMAAANVLARSPAAAQAASMAPNPIAYHADELLRRAGGPQGTANAPAADRREEVGRILSIAVQRNGLSDADRRYLAALAQQAGVSAAEAESRATAVYNETSQAVREAAEKARRSGIAGGLVAAVALLAGLAAAWYGAQRGGHHRDEQRAARLFPRTSGIRRA